MYLLSDCLKEKKCSDCPLRDSCEMRQSFFGGIEAFTGSFNMLRSSIMEISKVQGLSDKNTEVLLNTLLTSLSNKRLEELANV